MSTEINQKDFSLVIAAAGKGSRLGYHLPKILYPIAGKPIIEWMINSFHNLCQKSIFVVSPEGEPAIRDHLRELGVDYETAIQEIPRGMADAIKCSLDKISTPYTFIVWGDQVALQSTTIQGLALQFLGVNADVGLATKKVDSPYIHFERNPSQQITHVLQKREGDVMPSPGETDAGLFLFKTDVLKEDLLELEKLPSAMGKVTNEFNFLPLIPYCSCKGRKVVTSSKIQEFELMGVNTKGDGEKVKEVLLRGNL